MDAFRALSQAPCRILPPKRASQKAKEAPGLKASGPAGPDPSSATGPRGGDGSQKLDVARAPGQNLQEARAWGQTQEPAVVPWAPILERAVVPWVPIPEWAAVPPWVQIPGWAAVPPWGQILEWAPPWGLTREGAVIAWNPSHESQVATASGRNQNQEPAESSA